MGWFENIKEKIFGGGKKPEPAAAPASAAPAAPTAPATPVPPASATVAEAAAAPAVPAAPATQPSAATDVDVGAVLDAAVAAKGQKLDWRHSIVDLLKAIDVESSLTARKELAAELDYTGDTSDSASMNIWLHKQVLQKLAANGGKVPQDLLD